MANAERLTSLPQYPRPGQRRCASQGSAGDLLQGGAALGHVEEFYVEAPLTRKITAFEVSGAPGEGFLKGKAVLPAGKVRTIGKDILISRNGA